MDNVRDNLDRIRRRVVFELRKDKRKTAVALGLALLVAVLGLKLVVSGPRTSRAAEASDPVAVLPDETVIREAARMYSRPSKASAKAEYIQGIDRDIQRDIFRPKLEAFSLEGPVQATDTAVETPEGQEVEEHRRRRVEGEAQALRLQSTVVSATSTAIINGKVLTEGETINGFRVVEIKPHACLIEKEGVRIRLRMRS
jgi:hypothetical protein